MCWEAYVGGGDNFYVGGDMGVRLTLWVGRIGE